jgi:hypothetical protein
VFIASNRRVTVSVPGGLTWKSRVLATVNADVNAIGSFPVVLAKPDPQTGTVVIETNVGNVNVAWLVLD